MSDWVIILQRYQIFSKMPPLGQIILCRLQERFTDKIDIMLRSNADNGHFYLFKWQFVFNFARRKAEATAIQSSSDAFEALLTRLQARLTPRHIATDRHTRVDIWKSETDYLNILPHRSGGRLNSLRQCQESRNTQHLMHGVGPTAQPTAGMTLSPVRMGVILGFISMPDLAADEIVAIFAR